MTRRAPPPPPPRSGGSGEDPLGYSGAAYVAFVGWQASRIGEESELLGGGRQVHHPQPPLPPPNLHPLRTPITAICLPYSWRQCRHEPGRSTLDKTLDTHAATGASPPYVVPRPGPHPIPPPWVRIFWVAKI
ncbi:hypothetical protein CesoFtcFv8_023692 [Champsocephalus esox]|uniref:Uncharacterized protein n=1 Tax=Champsocephalus esox TaxID=159716 RepID=A0AAN8GDD9_9TELE|nr:hypothetical protein CesoFtcFv8_023692 [Champsocephalus esox]